MPDRMPDRVPEDMSEYMPEDMPDRMPDRMPDSMPEDMSDRMSEDLPVRKCINAMVGIIRSEDNYFPFHICDVILPIDELIFSKMVKTTNQTKKKMMMMMMNLLFAAHYFLTNSLNRRVAVSMPEASESYSPMSHVWNRYLLSFYRQ